jgi:rod shape-determining protein MreD
MTGAGARLLNPVVWLGAPMLLCAAASVVFALPVRIFGLALPEPVFALVPAFAWAVIRPSILPPFALVALGLFLDLLWGAPLGLWPICLLCAYAPVLIIRPALSGQDAWVMWALYAAVSAFALLAGVGVIAADDEGAPAIAGVVWQWLASVALFPLAHRLILRYEDADVRFR